MIQKSNKPKRQPGFDLPKSRDKKNPIQKGARRNPLQNGLQMDEGGFKQFLEAVPDGLVIVNAQGKIQFVNKQVEGMFGYQPEEMLGKPIELLIPERFTRHKEYREGYLNNLHSRPMKSGLLLFAARKDGTEFEADISLSPFEIEEETYIVAAIRDVTLQRLSEKQLKQSLNRYQQTLDNMLEGCQIIDFDWRYIYVNDVAASQGHRKPHELLMRTMMEAYPGIENTEMFTVLKHCMEERVSHQIENKFENPDGSIGWFELSIRPVAEGIFILSMDITERKQAEAAQLESGAQFRTLFEASPDAIVLIDPHNNWTILDCNTAACRMNGYTRDELIGQSIDLLNLEPAFGTERAEYLEQIQQAGVLHMEAFHRRKDGSVFPIEVATSLIMLGGRDIVLGIDRDITERRQAEALLVKSEKRFRALVEKSMEEVSMIDANGNLLFESPTTRRPLGYPPGSFSGHNLFELFHPDDKAGAIKLLEQVLGQSGSHREALFRLRHQDGSWRWMEGIVTNMLDEPAVQAVVVNYRDVTERKQAEEELFQSEERYRTLFEDSPISLWEEDFSAVKQQIEVLQQQGITDFQTYFSSHPEVVTECAALVRVVDVNKAALKLYQAQSKQDLLLNLAEVLDPETLKHFQEELVGLAEGRTQYNWEGPEKTLTGERIDVRVIWVVAPGHEENLSKVIVSIMDITERKQAEQALRQSDKRFRSLFENTPVSIWEEDFSQVKTYLEGLKDVYGTDLETYLTDHPDSVSMCVGLVKIIDVNRASMELHGARDKTELLENLTKTFTPESYHAFRKELVAIGKGELHLQMDEVVQTLGGLRRDVTVNWAVVPGYEKSLSRVLVSLIDITERKQAEEEIRTRTDELQTLYELSRALAHADDLDQVLDLVNHRTVESVHITFARIALLEGDEFVMRSAYPIRILDHDLLIGSRQSISRMPYCQRILEQDEPIILRTSSQEVSGEERAALLLDFAQTICLIPLRVHDSASNSTHILGLLMVGEARQDEREPFTAEKIRLARSIGDQAAIAIDNTRLFNNLQRSNIDLSLAYDATIAGWSAALDLRDKETEGHTQRVTEMTFRLAKRMGLSEQELVHVRRGALLHDIGKMGVPDRILLKPDKLTDEEWEVMRMHPTYAHQMLEPITYLGPALDIPYCHHEKWDGTGYPRGLRAEQIPLAARIFCIVDVYDALTSDRPYRKGWSREKTLEHIRELSGTHFEPKVVDVFLRMVEQKD